MNKKYIIIGVAIVLIFCVIGCSNVESKDSVDSYYNSGPGYVIKYKIEGHTCYFVKNGYGGGLDCID